jgi:simple sugar transport system permease protein
VGKGNSNKVVILIISLFISLIVGAVVFAMCGYSPLSAYIAILKGGLGSRSSIIISLSQTMIIAFMGLAYITAIRAGICNIGLEGQMYVGAIAAAIAGVYIKGIPSFIHVPLVLLMAIVAAGLWGMLVAVLKIRFGANEIITAIMLNFIAENFTSYLVSGPMKVEGTVAQSERVQDSAHLVNLVDTPQLSSGILIFFFLTIIIFLIMKYTRFGFEVRVTGENALAAETGGISAKRTMSIAMFTSGAIAGLAGAIIVIGVNGRFIDGFSSGFGWDGIAVASLAGLNVIGNIFSSFLFGVLRAGATVVNRTARIPYDFIVVIQAFIVLLLGCPKLSEDLYGKIRKIAVRKGKKDE